MPPDMAISMRHTKLKAEEAALLAGEINKPSWESRNEGIHERVSFEDTIWGFDLAGGSFYNTPLRVTFVKPDSRAEKAGIRPGDKLLRINDLDTSKLTIQEAHDIIVQSGIHLKLSVTSPEDEEDAYYCYEDPIVDGYDSEEERRLEEEKARKRRVCARVSHFWSLQWPWVSKRRLIYRESNCFMVPSKYEDARRDKYPPLPVLRYTDEIVHYSSDENRDNSKRIPSLWEVKQKARKERQERLAKMEAASDVSDVSEEPPRDMTEHEEKVKSNEPKETNQKSRRSTLKVERQETIEEESTKEETDENNERNEDITEETTAEMNGEMQEEVNKQVNEEINDEMQVDENEEVNEDEEAPAKEVDENNNDISNTDMLSPIPENIEETQATENNAEIENAVDEEINEEVSDDAVLNEVLSKVDSAPRSDDDNNILDSILSDEGQNLENSESNNER
uniref:PDZ domain-containing protein n=1 Tax=Heliothis virescens TaxID=7102 RepID=A0A2A4JIG7_HELVI